MSRISVLQIIIMKFKFEFVKKKKKTGKIKTICYIPYQ